MLKPHQRMIGTSHLRTRVLAVEDADGRLDELPNGIAMCFGWNSSGVGKKRGMQLIEVLLVAHGGSHNDTICTVERKLPTLF